MRPLRLGVGCGASATADRPVESVLHWTVEHVAPADSTVRQPRS
ncbi:MAG: hypothetical protein ACREMX_12615 [Gemmatimonadales bacterium]